MKKAYVSLAVLVVLASIAALVFLSRDETTNTSVDGAHTAATTKPACLENNEQLQLNPADQDAIEQAVFAQRPKVPAGTDVDMYYATYSGGVANGSAIYAKNYGSYNFTVNKVTSPKPNQLAWKVVSFVPCSK